VNFDPLQFRQMSAGRRFEKCPGLGGPGGKPAQAVVGIRLACYIASLHVFLFVSVDAMSESNARAIGTGAGATNL
jgi:hypothetical protein